MTLRWSNVSLLTQWYVLHNIRFQSHPGQKYSLNWQRRRLAPPAVGDMQCGLAVDWRFRRRSKTLGSSPSETSDDDFTQKHAGCPFRHWWGRQGPLQHQINNGILPWSRHGSKKELTHSRGRQLTFFRLPLMVKIMPEMALWEEKPTLAQNSMESVKRKMMRSTLYLPKSMIKHLYLEIALPMAMWMRSIFHCTSPHVLDTAGAIAMLPKT